MSMTREQWAEMSEEGQQSAVSRCAGECYHLNAVLVVGGFRECPDCQGMVARPGCPPDYLNNLNAMHAVVSMRIDAFNCGEYLKNLHDITFSYNFMMPCVEATAAQRAEAFVMTMDNVEGI